MSNSATCPRCCRVVSLPASDPIQATRTDAWVRCPLCHSEFRLQEAIDFVPPALEIIPQPAVAVATDVDALAPLPPSTPPGRPLEDQTIPDLLINPERETFVSPQHEFAPQQPFAPQPTLAQPAISQFTAGENDECEDFSLSPELPAVRAVPMPTRAGFQIKAGGGTSSPVAIPATGTANEPWDAAGEIGNQPAFFPTAPPKRPRGFRRARRRNPIVELLMIIVGGVMGCAIGYGVLLWGFKVDPFDLAKYLPRAILPEQFRSTDSSVTGEAAHDETTPYETGPSEPTSGELKAPSGSSGAVIRPTQGESEALPAGTAPPVQGMTSPANVPPPSAAPSGGTAAPGAKAEASPPLSTSTPPIRPELPPLAEPSVPPPESQADLDGPKTDIAYSLADVLHAISAATQADAALQAARESGDTGDAAAVAELRKQNYIALAKLAETVTLLRSQNDDRQIARSSAGALVLHAANNHAKLEELGTLASHWMNTPNRANRGIVLAGTVQSVEPVGKQFRTVVKLFGRDMMVPIISAELPDVLPNDGAIVLGALVPDPRQSFPQYAGKDEPVVWGAVVEKPALVASGGAF
ncbi:MAG TPA: hypothetical protein VMJ32_01035 [Pirellulales bacterium]|nr:hypothetical protein [Pirellulales bacterium]